jgi:hemerythrin-like domain-containing protein
MAATTPDLTAAAECPTSPEVKDASQATATGDTPLPKLTGAEFHQFNRMAEHMDYFHNNFRATWNTIYTACEAQKRPRGMSIKQFLGLGQQFCHHLTVHHTIEEQHIFPVLAKRMPAFKKEFELLTQHKQIHKGLDKLEKYLEECATGERELRMSEMKDIFDTFGTVLWQHLDDEVKQLGAENMRKYWTAEEIRRMPM